MINLVAEPGAVLSWDEFIGTKPPYSIALDGYVNSVSDLDFDGPYLNLDHHSGVRRLITRSTCAQSLPGYTTRALQIIPKRQPNTRKYLCK